MSKDRELRILRCGGARAVALSLVLCLALSPVATTAENKAAAPAAAEKQPPAASVRQSGDGKLFDVDAAGTDIRFVLEALARRSGANIVVSPEVTGDVTAHVKQMPLDSILTYLSTVQGFGWEKSGITYLVAAKDKFAPLPAPAPQVTPPPPPVPSVLVWECRHIRPADAVALLTKILPGVTTAEGPASFTPTLDTAQGGSYGPAGAAGAGPDGGGSAGSSGGKYTSCRLVLTGPAPEVERAKELLKQLDLGRPQVNIDVAITEVGSSAKKELGISWSWSDLVLSEPTAESGIHFGNLVKKGMTFTGTISALINNGGAKLLAQPNISVIDGENASILIGDRIAYPKLIGYSSLGSPLYDKAEEQVGISLQIAPKVTDDDKVLLTLYPQVSLVTSYLKTQAGDYPQISTREARTTVSVRHGETIAIGGLLRDEEIKQMSKIPLLGNLPIIGGLFRHTKTTSDRTEIVIFLTPRIASDKQGE